MLPWRSMKDSKPENGQRVMAIQANPIIGTEIITAYGNTLNGTGNYTEPFVTHWCPTTEIEIPAGVPAVGAIR